MNKQAIETHALSIDFTVYYSLLRPSGHAGNQPNALLLALHGWGGNAPEFIQRFQTIADRNFLVIAPQGPHQFYLRRNREKVGFNWLTKYQKENSIKDINRYLAQLTERIREQYGLAEAPVFVLGFSQGVSVAYRFALSGWIRPGGIVACSADLASDVEARLDKEQPVPVFLSHGSQDRIVPVEKARHAKAALEQRGWPVEYLEFEGGHELREETILAIYNWTAGLKG